jgi:hypothetical protein
MKVNEIFTEAAVRQYKKNPITNKLERKFRCTTGLKKGKIAASQAACSQRPDPKKRRKGKQIMRAKKSIIQRKSKISKAKTISKTLSRLNARMMGKGGATATK